MTGLDRTPGRVAVELRNGMHDLRRATRPRAAGSSSPGRSRATAPRWSARRRWPSGPRPYVLAVELARGKLNDVRNQLADWMQMGLRSTPELARALDEAQRAFIRAATSADQPEACLAAAREAARLASNAGDLLMEAYTAQVFQSRLATTSRLPTHLGCVLDGEPAGHPAGPGMDPDVQRRARRASPGGRWRRPRGSIAGTCFDAQLAWARRNRLAIEAGPLIEFRKGALPDWLWLWEGDFETIGGLVADYVRQAVSRYKGKVPLWHVVHRAAAGEILGLTEEEQVRIAARAVQVARQADPSAQVTIGVDRPWAEWMGSSHFQLGPAAPLRLPAPRRAGHLRDRPGDRPGLFGTGQPHPRPVRVLQAAGPLLAAERPAPPVDGHALGRPVPTRTPSRVSGSRRPQWPAPARRGDAGELGRAVDRPGHRQAVRPHA